METGTIDRRNGPRLMIIIAVFVCSAVCALEAEAAIITVGPSNCSSSAVNNAIASASDGDTVQLTCTGSVTWTAPVSIPNTKGITLSGGGTNTPKSSASFPLTIVSAQSPAVQIVAAANKSLSRITGF